MLKLADNLKLPLDFATKTAAILAQRRKGKTYTASVIAEEMVAAKQPFVALDPTGAWWGLRAGADGKSDGLPVVVLGGQHGDVPLERTGGRLIADLVVEEPGYYVIDFSLFESGEAERQFAVDFAERLYRAKGQPGRDFPLHLFVDEADRFIPQQMRKGSNETSPRLLGAFEAIVRRGGLRGLGTTLISQRAAIVNKNVLEMIDILIALRTVGPNDRDAIDGYIKAHGTSAERTAMMDSLASLDIGEAWVWEPGAEPPLFRRVQMRRRHTFNSSATPKPGEKRAEPKRLADVDLAALQKRMAATIEKAKAEDPRELRKQVADLKKELASKSSIQPPKESAPPKVVEKPVLKDGQLARAEKLVEQIEGVVERARPLLEQLNAQQLIITRAIESTRQVTQAAQVRPQNATQTPRQAPSGSPQAPSRRGNAVRPPSSGAGEPLPVGEKATLIAAAQYPEGLTREQATILTGYKRSTRDAYIQRLQGRGYVEVGQGVIVVTQEGIDALGSDYEPLPTGTALQDYWLNRLPAGECAVLEQALKVYPHEADRDAVSEATGFKRSTRDAYIQRLSARRLVVAGRGAIRASGVLFE